MIPALSNLLLNDTQVSAAHWQLNVGLEERTESYMANALVEAR